MSSGSGKIYMNEEDAANLEALHQLIAQRMKQSDFLVSPPSKSAIVRGLVLKELVRLRALEKESEEVK